MDFYEILEYVTVPNRDNGWDFTDTQRIDRITRLLWNSKYRRVNHDGLFFLFAPRPLEDIDSPILISSHIDCEEGITLLFSREYREDLMLGTYDNSITNAAVLSLMISGVLPDNVIVAFTGDEERSSAGAAHVYRLLTRLGKTPAATLVLDVTDMGWQEDADFTVENNFWNDNLGQAVVRALEPFGKTWHFVPEDPENVPAYVPGDQVIPEEAEADESWEYDEHHFPCFSFCLPVRGPMHSNRGVLVKKRGCEAYVRALGHLAAALAGEET